MRRTLTLIATVALLVGVNAYAEDEEQAELSPEVLAELAALPDNTQATSNVGNTASIIEEEGSSGGSGAIPDKVTLHRTSAGVDVYNGLNKVEAINEGSDGWVGHIEDNGSSMSFEPSGRPHLTCPSQAISNWYGPCEIAAEG